MDDCAMHGSHRRAAAIADYCSRGTLWLLKQQQLITAGSQVADTTSSKNSHPELSPCGG
jgi:hypothetical protein